MSTSRQSAGAWLRILATALGLSVALAPPAARAATLTWGTSGTGGNGTWDTTTAGWWTGSALTTWANATPDSAVFAGTPGTVSMGAAITAGSVTFNVNGFALAGNNNLTASTLAGSGNATWLSSGTLTLSGASGYTGQFTIANGLVQLSSGASLSSASGIVLTGGAGTVGGTGYPFKGLTRNGTLYLRDDTGAPGANQLMTTGTVTMRNGTILWYSGGGADSTTITNVLLDTGFNSIGVAPSGGTPDALTITNLTRTAGATTEFRASYAPLGTGGEVQIKVTNLNGAPIANTNGILGGWAFVSQDTGENALAARSFAAWNPLAVVGSSTGSIVAATPDFANGTSGATTNSSDIALATGTQNWLINDSSTRNVIGSVTTGTVTINSLIEQADLKINNGSTLVLQSGGLIFRNNNFWMQTTAGSTGFLTSGINDLFVQTDAGSSGDQFIKVIITDGTAGAVTLRKSGTGTLKVNQANTYSGGTVINQGTVLVAGASFGTNGYLGSGTVTINGGGVLQPNAAHVFGWTGGTFTPVTINDGGVFAIGGNDNYIGTLTLTDNAAITGSAYVGLTSGTVTYTGNYATSQATIAPKVQLQNSAGTAVTSTFTVNGTNPAGDLVVNGVIQAGGGVTKAGTGILKFTAANTYTGTTTLNAGTLLASSSNALPAFGTSGRVVFGGGTLQIPVDGTNWTIGQVDTIFTNATKTSGALAVEIASGSQTQTGSGYSGGIGLTKLGAGTLVLAANNTYSGTTTISSGTLQVNTGGSLGGGNVANAATLAFNSTGSGTVAGAISGAGLITQIGTGTTTLTGNSTNTGNVTINAGTLKVSGAGAYLFNAAYNNTSVVTVNTGGTLELDSFVYGAAGSLGQLSDYSQRRILAGGTINIVGTTQSSGNDFQVANGSSGGFFMTQGGQTLTLSGNGNADILIGGPLTIGGAGNITVSELITNNTGAGSIIKTGTGTLQINTNATYTGNTTVNEGTLVLNGGGSPGTIRGTVTVNAGATLRLASNDAMGYSTGADRLSVINLVGGTMNVTATTNNTMGSATLNLTGAAITGTSAGNLDFFGGGSTLNSLASSTTSTISGVPLSPLRQSGGSTFTVAAGTTPSGIDLDISSVLQTSPSGDNANAVLTKAGAGTMRLSGANTYARPTAIRSGTILAANSSALGTSGTVTLGDASTGSNNTALLLDTSVSGGQVQIARPIVVANQGTGTAILGSSTGSQFTAFTGPVTLAKDVTLYGGNSFRTSFTGTISGNGNVTIAGPGLVAFRVAGNTYAGTTTINAGSALQLGDGNAGGSLFDFLPDNYAVTVSGTLNLQKTGTSETIDALLGGGVVGAQSGADTLIVGNAGGSGTFSGILQNTATGTLGFTKSGAGTQILTGPNTYTGATAITGGTLEIGGSGVLGGGSYAGAITNNATLSIATSANQTLAGGISGSGKLVKSAAATLTLSGSNSFTGGATLAAGTVALGNADALGTTGTLTFTGGTLQYSASNAGDYGSRIQNSSAAVLLDTNGQNVTYAGAVDATNTSGLTKLGSGTLTLAATNAYSGATTISAGVLRLGNGGSAGSVAGNIVNNASLRVDRSDAYTLSNLISGSGGVVQAGSGTTTLSGVNTYAGATTVTGGMLAVSTDLNLGAAPGSATPGSIVIDGGSLAFTSGFTLSSNRGIALGPTVGSGSGTIDVASGQTLIYGGVLANNGGTGGLVKAGAGTLQLSGAATYTGNTAVDAGTLQVGTGASLASSLVNVASGATLSGRGTVNATTIADGGILWPGLAGSGTLTTGSLTFSGSATVTMGVSGVLPTNRLNVVGDVTTFGTGTSVVFAFGSNLSLINTGTYALLTYSGTLSDASAFGYTGTTGGRQGVAVSGTTVAGAVSLIVSNAFPLWTGTNGNDWFAGDNWKLNTDNKPTNFQNNDTVDFNDGATLATGTVVISGSNATPASVTFSANSKPYTLEATGGFGISTGAVVKSGSALVTITNANSYDGGTTLSLGRIRVGDNAALGTGEIQITSPAALSSDGVTSRTLANALHVDADVTLGDSTDTGALTFSGTVTFDGVTRTITTLSNVTLSGAVTNGGLTKSGSGVLAITGSNTYANGTTLSAGTLRVGNNSALGAGAIALNGGAFSSNDTNARTLVNAFTLGGDVTLGDGTNTGALSLGSVGGVNLGGSTRQVTTPSNVTFAGPVTNGGLTKLGDGTLTLAVANSYADGTTVSAGDIALGNVAGLGTGTAAFAGAGAIRNTVGGTIANAVAVNSGASGTFDSAANATTLSGAVANAGTFTLTTTATQTLSGVVSGSGTLVKAGAGALALAGTNTLTGAVSLTAGRLDLNSAAALGTGSLVIAGVSTLDNTSGGGITLTGANPQNWDANFTFAGSNALNLGTGAVTLGGSRQVTVTSSTLTVGGGIGGGFALTKAGTGTLVLSASNGYSGGTTLSAGTLLLGNASALGSGSLALDGGSLDLAGLSVSNAVVLGGGAIGSGGTLSGAVSGAGLVKSGAGTLTLSGSNSYTGGTTVSGGTLAVSADSNLGAVPGSATPGNILVNGGVLAATAGFTLEANRGIALGSATGTGTGTIDVASGQTLAYGGVVANNGAGVDGLVKTGAGTLSLSGASTYTGPTTISAGVLQLAGAGQLGGGSYAGAITNSGTFSITTSAAQTLSGAISSAGSIAVNSSGNQTISGSVSGAGTIAKSGAGTLTLSGNNTFSGQLTVSQGTLSIPTINGASANGTLGNSALAVILGSSGLRGTLAYTGATASSSKAFTLATGGTGAVDVTGGTTLTLSGSIDGSGGFVKEGAGTLAISTQKTYTGNTIVNAGVLSITGGGDAAGAIRGTVTVNPGATFRLASNDATGYGTSNQITAINVTSGTLDITTVGGSGQNQTLGNCVITLTGAAMTGVGTTNLDFFQTSSALTTLASSATSTISGVRMGIRQSAGLTFTVADGAADTDLLVSSEIYSNASYTTAPLIKAGAGKMTLTAVNGLAAGASTNINAGTLAITGAGQLYNVYANNAVVTINSGATLELDSFGYGTNGGLGQLRDYGDARLLRGGTINIVGSTQSTGNDFSVANGFTGAFNMTTAGQTLTLSGNSNSNIAVGGALTFGGAGNITVNEVIENNTGAGSIIKAGAGTLTFGAAMTYTGSTTINSGTFVLTGAGQLGGGNYGGAITNNAAFVISNTVNQTLSGGITNAGTITVTSTANQTVSGLVSGAGLITKAGGGTFTLSNASNSITGGVSLSAGVLSFVSGGLGSSGTITLGGGTLQWAGSNTTDLSSRLALLNSATTTLDIGSNNVTFANGIGGGSTAAVTKAGNGAMTLSSSNGFSGGLTVSAGSVLMGNDAALGSGAVTLANGATLSAADASARAITNAVAVNGDVTLGDALNNGPLSFNGGMNLGNATRQLTTPSNVTIASVVSNGGLTKAGGGTLTLSAANTYAGVTTISGGTLALSGVGDISSGSAALVTIASGAVLDISGASGARTIGALSDAGNVILGGNTLRSFVPDSGSSFGGVISGSGGFTKAGTGQLDLGNIQAFTGVATVEAGKLLLASGTGLATASRIYVAPGATIETYYEQTLTIVNNQTLGGYGTVSGPLALLAGGTLSPGGSVGTLNGNGDITFNGGTHYLFEVNDASGTPGVSPGWDLFSTTGGVTLAITGTDQIFIDLTSLNDTISGSAANFDPNSNYAWKFVVAGSTIGYEYALNPTWFKVETGAFQNTTNGSFYVARGDQLSAVNVTDGTSSELYVVYAAVPEPGALALAGIGLAAAGLASARRRRHKRCPHSAG